MIAAGEVGIYVGVMLFDGWALHLSPPPDHIEGHPFHAQNNINGISAESINDLQVLPLDARVEAIQEAYIRKVVDTLHDLPNVLWEVANESTGDGSVDKEFASIPGDGEPPVWGDSTDWQYWVIDVVKRHEAEHGYDDASDRDDDAVPGPRPDPGQRAAAAQPGRVDLARLRRRDLRGRWASDGTGLAAIALVRRSATRRRREGRSSATRTTSPQARATRCGRGSRSCAAITRSSWTSGCSADSNRRTPGTPEAGVPPFEAFEPARLAMGDTRLYAERMGLVDMEPRGDLSSTGYALAHPGSEYLILDAGDGGATFSVTLEAGTYATEWHSLATRETQATGDVDVPKRRCCPNSMRRSRTGAPWPSISSASDRTSRISRPLPVSGSARNSSSDTTATHNGKMTASRWKKLTLNNITMPATAPAATSHPGKALVLRPMVDDTSMNTAAILMAKT